MHQSPLECCLLLLVFLGALSISDGFLRTYDCLRGSRCERSSSPIIERRPRRQLGSTQHLSLQACRLACSPSAGLWPIPTGPISTSSNYLVIDPKSFQFLYVNDLDDDAKTFMSEATERFMGSIYATCGPNCQPSNINVAVHLKIENSNLELDWKTNEGYDLGVSSSGSAISVLVSAQTVFGALHGLETLSQLVARVPVIANNETVSEYERQHKRQHQLVMLDEVSVRDKPVFAHRGLLIDTGRNFLPVRDILRTIDALASVKMNVLHWHATDTQSFPLEIRSVPQMALYGAYGPDKIYTVEDMQAVTKYAKARGIRVILEIDSPSHAGAGWDWGESVGLGNLSVCVNQQPWRSYCIQPPCGQLNPINPNTFVVFRSMYEDLLKTFGRNQLMHLGGDELFINCWNSTDEVVAGMSAQGLGRNFEDFLRIWSDLHNQQIKILDEESNDHKNSKVILWSSHLTTPEWIQTYLNKSRFIIQTWVEANKTLNKELLDLGYQLIISTKDAWYLDHGFWGITKYHTWRDAYKNQIPQHPGVLGGEACMWGEYVFGSTLDSRVWPRTAAVAERLWSDPSNLNTEKVEPRLQAHIYRLNLKKIYPEAIAPEWCNQHEGQCL
ncbi:hypothetical protein QAD02_006430 [Eretmocerus hayati]|uniref:Uncharacterized protein n=1 Tax=Eretmocerus hayati TaxID=131215 RepID=A0ACC2N1C1_9HYME|nr:hypothetical protein QAD02_006430 [Eretmocerus hayati]